jgi:sterol desaturase/sphingolipid hydroxylase (fatty acid hydroxylase superfamily)
LRNRLFRNWVRESLRNLVRDALLLFFIVLVALWSLPLISELLSLGSLAAPVPLVVLVVLAIVAVRTLTDMHRQLVNIFNRTFLGGPVELGSFANGAPVGQVPTAQTARVGTAAAEDQAEDSAVGPAAHTRNLDASARGRRFWQPRTWPRPRSRTAIVALFSSCALLLLALGWTMGYWLSSWSEWWFLAD